MSADNGICCPPPGPGLHPRPMVNSTAGVPTTPGSSPANPLYVADASIGGPALPTYDRETTLLCDPTTGARVIVTSITLVGAAPGTPPTVEAYTTTGAPYAGSIPALVACGGNGEQRDIAAVQFFCDGTQTLTRTDVWDVEALPPTLAVSIWQDLAGAVVAAPVAASLSPGPCGTVSCVAPPPAGIINTWG